MRIGVTIKRLLLAAAVLVCHPWTAEACAVCFGKTNDRLQIGMNYGIGVLIVAIGATLTGISGFFYYIAARTKRVKGQLKTSQFRNSAEI